MTMLQAQNISFAYRTGQDVLRGVSVEVRAGCVTTIFGPNGCGKSTLLKCLNGSLRPAQGRVLLDGGDISRLNPAQVAREVAVVPQDTPADVPLSARQIVMLGRYAHWGFWGRERPEDMSLVALSLERAGAGELAGRPFAELSGGERQRVVIARALAQQGQVLLLDEPASHLDIAHQLELYRLIRSLARQGQAVLMVCHDIFLAPMFTDTAVLMSAGRVVAAGQVSEVLNRANLASTCGVEATLEWRGADSIQALFHGEDRG